MLMHFWLSLFLMPTPYTVYAATAGLNAPQPNYVQVNGTDLYAILIDTTVAGAPLTRKSTDSGVTWNTVAGTPDVYQSQYAVGRLGTSLYMAYVPDGSVPQPLNLVFKTLNMATDTWSSASAAGPTMQAEWGSERSFYHIAVRSGGELLLIYNGSRENVGGTNYARVYIDRYSGGAWAGPTVVSGQSGNAFHYYPAGLIIDSTGRTHAFLHRSNNSGTYAGSALYHITYSTSNSFGTLTQIDTQMFYPDFYRGTWCVSAPILYTEGVTEKIAIGYNKLTTVDSVDGASVQIASAAVADVPSWTVEEVSNSAGPGIGIPFTVTVQIAIAWYNDALYAFWQFNGFSTFDSVVLWSRNDGSPLGWSIPGCTYVPPRPYTAHQLYATTEVAGGIGLLIASYQTDADLESAVYMLFTDSDGATPSPSPEPVRRGNRYAAH